MGVRKRITGYIIAWVFTLWARELLVTGIDGRENWSVFKSFGKGVAAVRTADMGTGRV